MREIRKRLGRPLQRLAYATGGMKACSYMRAGGGEGGIILMYHSVAMGSEEHYIDQRNHVPGEVFEKQMSFLVKHRTVVSLWELVSRLHKGEKLAPGTIALTFDDGYLDNLTWAGPILSRLGLPATLFLATGYVDRGEAQWVDQAHSCFKYRTEQELKLVWEGHPRVFQIDDPGTCALAYDKLCSMLLSASPESRRATLESVRGQLQPGSKVPRLTLTWEDVQRLQCMNCAFEIGAHTVEHRDLTAITMEKARAEVFDCLGRIEERAGVRPRLFSFPYGRTGPMLRNLVSEAGFVAACGGGGAGPVVRGDTLPLGLPRVKAPRTMDDFDLITSAENTGFWRKLGG
jgi:peptidoglycan/xylan/chitin deacetylase (PgdA/CDA1 family)